MKPSRLPVHCALALALAAASLPALAQDSYSQTVFFGDSLTDSGSFRPGLVQVGGPAAASLGRFTTNPGLVWAEFLAEHYGTNAVAANQGGDNYAVGGARIAVEGTTPFGAVPSLVTQLNNHLAANGGRADANALYTVWGGANDLFAVASGAESQATLVSAVTAQVGLIGRLQAGGAQYILVPNIPDLGQTPEFLAQGPVGSAGGTLLATSYNNALFASISAAGLRVIPLDTFGFLREITASPSTYGFVNVTDAACDIENSLTCSPANFVAPGVAETYVFADGVHPTTDAHRMLSQYTVSVLEAPRQIAVLPHSAAHIGRARADRVAGHLAVKPEADGMRWWGGVRGDSQRYEHGDLYDGVAPAGLFGVDWAHGAMVYGAYAGYGSGTQDFGLRRGSFKQSDTSLGGFLAWYGDGLWLNAQLGYTWLGFEVDREVQLGPATRRHSGSPDGSNLSAGISAGYDFGEGSFTHGPVLSLLSQQIKVEGYSESNSSATAMRYGEQRFDSLVGSAGWQASYAANAHFSPYARLTYDREFERAPEHAFAQLQSIAGLAPYAVPGLEMDRGYASLTLGARTRVFGVQADIGLGTTLGKTGGANASVFASVAGSF